MLFFRSDETPDSTDHPYTEGTDALSALLLLFSSFFICNEAVSSTESEVSLII